VSFVLLIPLLLLAAALIVLIGPDDTRNFRAKIAAYPIGAACCGAIGTLYVVAVQEPISIRFYDPGSVASLIFPIGFYIDRLSAIMMTLITGVSALIFVYSTGYMYQDRHMRRYLALICFTDFVLICMVSSANLMMLFLFWQILSYLLYLLAHNHEHAATLKGAFNTFTLLRVADAAFLAGIVLAYGVYGTLEFQELFARATERPVAFSLWPGIDISAATAITLLIFVGAMGKSAQFPLHFWLPRSLYAPTPVHALLHAGIINAGGFLINRLAPLFGLSSTTLHVAFVVGTLTAVLGASMMLAQNDIKKTLGFSTIGQMGYMIMECGLGAFSLAVFHLIAHGLFKATVFLNCGNVIHKARQEPHVPHVDQQEEEEKKVAEAMKKCKEKAEHLGLPMKVVGVDFQSGGEKITFFFTAETRINFRELVKQLASEFHARIEMRQIGARNEAKMMGGVGCCGLPLCCVSFLPDFEPVTIRMAKDQGLSLDPTKISGLCGRLLCCLEYEASTYSEFLKDLPKCGSRIVTSSGEGKVIKQNVLSKTLLVAFDDGRLLTIKVEEIKEKAP